MPFIVRCINPKCQRFMLLEDEVRGTSVECLLCKTPFKTDSSSGSSGDGAGPPALPNNSSSSPVTAKREKVVNCPRCNVTLQIPAIHSGKQVRCPKCSHTFTG